LTGILICSVPDDSRVSKIAESLQASSLVDVDESKTKLRRNPDVPLPEGNSEERTVYLKGFSKTESTLDELLGELTLLVVIFNHFSLMN